MQKKGPTDKSSSQRGLKCPTIRSSAQRQHTLLSYMMTLSAGLTRARTFDGLHSSLTLYKLIDLGGS